MIQQNRYSVDDTVRTVAVDPPVYQPPKGLPDGATVAVIKRGPDYVTVQHEGKHYVVSMVLIDSGWQRIQD